MSENHTDNNGDKSSKKFDELLDYYNQQNKESSFEYLLDSYTDGMKDDIQVGDKINGKIISIGGDTVYVDTKSKVDGAVEKAELLDENGEFLYKNGDALELYVVALNESEMILSRALSGIGGINLLEDAFENAIPVDGTVREPCKGGFHVEVLQKRAFCPVSQMDVKYVENPDDYTGKAFQFLITQFEENGRNIVVSRWKLLETELVEVRKKFFEEVTVGDLHEGKVVKIMPYGVFVELMPGIEGMIHISEISWSRSVTPGDIFNTGDPVKVKVIGIVEADGGTPPRISLSIKQIENDPWNSINDKFYIGDSISGKVTRCMKFGAFVEIAPGIEGLVHISEMSYVKRILKPEDVVNPGDIVNVIIKEIDPDKKRISLSIKDADGDPWADVNEKYSIGQSLEGTIEKKENFGYFIKLSSGITGLLPKSRIIKSYDPSSFEKKSEGETISVKIEEIHVDDRKITLDVADSVESSEWKTFSDDKEKPVGTLGEKLQQALNAKEEPG